MIRRIRRLERAGVCAGTGARTPLEEEEEEEKEGVEGVTLGGKGWRAAQNLPGEGVPSVRMRELAVPPPPSGAFALANQSSKTRTARFCFPSLGVSAPSH